MEARMQARVEPGRAAVEAAARWFVLLQDEAATAQTFSEWNKWLAESPENRIAYDEIESTILRLNRIPVRPALPSKAEMAADTYDGSLPIAEVVARPAPQRRWPYFAVAASVLIACTAGLWLWLHPIHQGAAAVLTYQTERGQRRNVELQDGSQVTLDADSAIETHFTDEERLLSLIRGEAYFRVAKDRERPFVVEAGGTEIVAVGTAFNIRRTENRTVIAVVEGKVEVTSGKALLETGKKKRPHALRLTAQVAAGEAISYVDDGVRVLPSNEASLAIGWLDGHRRYRREPLRYVLADVGRYTGLNIEIADEATGALQFTGTLDFRDGADWSTNWLKGLAVALPVNVTQLQDGKVVIARR
jgi:transmembrane sensor